MFEHFWHNMSVFLYSVAECVAQSRPEQGDGDALRPR